MIVPIKYAFEFGKCDVSDWMPGDVLLTPEEADIYNGAVSRGEPLEDVTDLKGALARAADEIEEVDGLDEGVRLLVEFDDPNN